MISHPLEVLNLRILAAVISLLCFSGHLTAQDPETDPALPTNLIKVPSTTAGIKQDPQALKSGVENTPVSAISSNSPRELMLEARIRELERVVSTRSARELELEQRLRSLEEALTKTSALSASSSSLNQLPGIANPDTPPGEEAIVAPGIDTSIAAPSVNPLQIPPDLTMPEDFAPGYDVVEESQGVPSSGTAGSATQRNMPFTPKLSKGYSGTGPGFVISSDDDEYQLQIHDLTQFDLRQYNFQTMNPTKSGFGIPRQWTIFNGRLTKPIEYFVALNFGFTNLNLIDSFVNFHYDDRFQVKIGRFKTPWSYEFYTEPITGLVNPERSIFFNNYGPNRDTGIMLWGQIFNKTTDYAVGVFNGVRNGFEENNNAKEVIAYLNSRPFEKSDIDILKYWNIGGSTSYNVYNQKARPDVFRTNIPYPGDPIASPQWLILDGTTEEFGTQKLWSLHSAWYYNSLSVIGEWYGGFNTYSQAKAPTKGEQVGTGGWYAQVGYFLTGEKVTSRGMVSPIRPFDPKSIDGLGALELGFRWANQTIDNSIFMFAPANRWTNDTDVVDLGMNWYWNDYVKFYLGWQRAMYGKPIQAAPGLTPSSPPSYWMSSTDMFWFRAQLYY